MSRGRAEPLAPAIAAAVEPDVIAVAVDEFSTGCAPAMKTAALLGGS